MGKIYRNAVCTVAALHSKDSEGGCFSARDPLLFRDVRYRRPDGRTLFASRATRPSLLLGACEPHDPGFPSPLHTRAWVFQEHILSPRTIFYGSSQVFWECLKCSASEQDPQPREIAQHKTRESLANAPYHRMTSL
jgi:hypothetical protein